MTRYQWPTWADMVGQEIEEYHNFGQSGAGNVFISNQIAEANLRHNFNEDDLIMVMWSTVTREDRYINKHWNCYGNIYFQNFYDKDFIMKYVDNRGQLIRDLALIAMADGLLKTTKATYHMLSMQSIDLVIRYETNKLEGEYKDVMDLYKPVIDLLEHDLLMLGCNGQWPSLPIKNDVPGGQTHDYHPPPKTHFNFINKVFPYAVWSQKTIDFMEFHDNIVMNARTQHDLVYQLPWPSRL
jgi:hypothetical protein